MELLSIIQVTSVIIQVIVLIVFFVMASNVSKIKKQIIMSTKQYFEAGDMEAYAGNNEKAKEYYLKAKYRMDVLKDFSNMTADNKPYPGMSRTDLEDKINKASKEYLPVENQ